MPRPVALQNQPKGGKACDTRYSVREYPRSRDRHKESFIIIPRKREKEQSIQWEQIQHVIKVQETSW
jgi:hypothetical protein